jgi:phage shock protein PspC (stress-responsive transcriptional regulator)
MNKVTTINLNGRAYQLEEAGYDALHSYLATTAAKLEGNPDKDEIMADFEQAIADKCDDVLHGHKNVVSAREIEAIITTMGPVDATGGTEKIETEKGDEKSGASKSSGQNATKPRRLFRIPPGEWIAGVCNGLAAYFSIDVTLVRILFVLFGLVTHGILILAYIALAIIMPIARTSDDLAEAHGTGPVNAHDFIEQAKTRYAEFQKEHPTMPADPHDREAWGKWKQDMKAWKRQMREDAKAARHEWRNNNYGYHHSYTYKPGSDVKRGWFSRILSLFFGVILVILAFAWIYSLWTIIAHGMIFNYGFPSYHPLWISLLFVTLAFFLISIPLRLMIRGLRRPGSHLAGFIIFILALIGLFWTAHYLFPNVNTWWNAMLTYPAGIH